MSSFVRLLADGLPAMVANPRDASCILSRYYYADRPEMSVISDAVDIVESLGGRSALIDKLKREHPIHDLHDEQFDERAFDVLTEACAFAWAARIAGLGTPRFSTKEGAPDLYCDSGCWVEAKAIHSSDTNKALLRTMRETGEGITGVVTEPGPGLLRKLQLKFENAQRKFDRQEKGPFLVFFNVTSVDLPQIPIKEDVLKQLARAATSMAAVAKDIDTVVCYAYDWTRPIGGTITN